MICIHVDGIWNGSGELFQNNVVSVTEFICFVLTGGGFVKKKYAVSKISGFMRRSQNHTWLCDVVAVHGLQRKFKKVMQVQRCCFAH